ncbi:urease accessory protein UreF [Microtetraspora sp. NBRC 13810]|uniref:urease accessory protein UreF n=1 Tax=Microtetraspora sp. NBRC 13810 TaxID=3030990 RepID=UPI0024A0AD94|nr:urease accessory UreF family protein [Microtetraspora sp. NBRC 13810]GLW08612.1 urease accessory protein UreF [Microtetraspora sp. NBRC 13810]
MNASLLLLADSRLPAGGHAHSGGAERAVATGAVRDEHDLAAFLHGRLTTTGRVAASLAAASCALATTLLPDATPAGGPASGGGEAGWTALDAEADARTASPAQRAAARTQGRLLLRVARRIWPSPVLDGLALAVPSPHHPVALGAVAAVAGCPPRDAALAAAYHSVTGPATAAVRLLGLDPVAVHRLLATLSDTLDAIAGTAAASPHPDPTPPEGSPSEAPDVWAALPAHAAPALDLLAEQHVRATTRLFVS